jgi:hypothetical protein
MVDSVYRSGAQGADTAPPWNTRCIVKTLFPLMQFQRSRFTAGFAHGKMIKPLIQGGRADSLIKYNPACQQNQSLATT